MSIDAIENARGNAAAMGSSSLDDRYSRQRLFPPIGTNGQQRLAASHAILVGCGATGAASAGLLARAGVGHLTIIDRDFVEPSNLQRQMLFTEEDAREALPKAEAARRRLLTINSEVTVTAHIADLTPANARVLLADADIILDATDNFETRYLLNDLAVETGTPWIYAAAIGSYAATMNILPSGDHRTACLACIFPEPPGGTVETCDTAGILNTAVNVAASLQSTEAIKLLTGQPSAMRRTLLSMDLWTGEHSEISTAKPRSTCSVCGQREFRHLAGEGRPHITMCGRNSVQIHEHNRPVDFASLADRLRPLGEVRWNSMMLRFTYSEYTLSVFADGRTVVQGTDQVPRARALYARFIGS
ncbi:dinucleotide-utilizing enzyme possibly involved in molybdopterin or thiamin biosynthesis [Terriglobus roseus DSM 18391]|uniref:Dinucleotide-utilizing enzyme possibly involved in molybdopterin or thiamin biosynthesis n=1 Tax=Terriglobus roseus (strain DSM 18391 / NRRL B-41598 / KBS 63) TaxID=926566 RepID=I3ZJP0_TERRK|nr:ThiF family adenylyltransferase [Terriglobus roseus]AFL89458.1 dinucleotide-utilizing enzyme possibly involved in molybdopterin or thiamin biosynthesis [Terriglobus roseus DSM 18391]